MATLRPSLQKEVLFRGIAAEFSSLQEIFEKVKDIKDSSQYDIGLRMANNVTLTAYKPTVKTSKPMFYQPQTMTEPTQRNLKLVFHPQLAAKVSNSCPHVPNGMETPLKEGELCCYKCGQKGHI